MAPVLTARPLMLIAGSTPTPSFDSPSRRVLRRADLQTTSGPDLRVWLTAAPVAEGRAGWFDFDDHPHRELGTLRGNRGNQNYAIPPEADLTKLEYAVIRCRRLRVSFGVAELSG